MAWNLFGKKDKQEDENKELQNRIEEALRKARNDKNEVEREMRQLDGWARDVIIETYSDFFENAQFSFYKDKHKATALEEYEDIKQKYAGKIPTEMAEKCDKIVHGYLAQIELSKSKLKLYEKLENEYQSTKQKLAQAIKRNVSVNKLDEHSQRLKSMNESADDLSDAITDSYRMEDIKDDVAFKEEYFNQLDKLTIQYGNTDNYAGAEAYKEEVDKMLKKLE